MKNLSIVLLLSILCSFNFLRISCYKNIRFSSLKNINHENSNIISEDLKGVNAISEELISNEREEGEDEDEEDEEGNSKTSFDAVAHKSLENAEKEAVVELEDVETENLLDNEIFKIVQERLKKLWYIGKCKRDYSNMCPLGWNKSAYDVSLCIPPKTYQGQCRSMDFANSSSEDKELFAWKCEVEWACVKSPPLKVMDSCPVRWIKIGSSLCIAPQDYKGSCPPALDFTEFSFEMRIRMAQQCNFEWPVDVNNKVMNAQRKYYESIGGPVEESGDVIKIVHTASK